MRIKINSDKARENIIRRFKEFENNAEQLDLFAKRIVRNVKADAVEGINYNKESFPELSSSWEDRKSKLLDVNSSSRFYGRGKSNVSFMGDLLKSIAYKIRGNEIILLITGNHRKVKGIRGKYLEGSNSALADIYDGLASRDKAWGFLGVSQDSKAYLKTIFIRFLRRK
jgi:hypothetical protein